MVCAAGVEPAFLRLGFHGCSSDDGHFHCLAFRLFSGLGSDHCPPRTQKSSQNNSLARRLSSQSLCRQSGFNCREKFLAGRVQGDAIIPALTPIVVDVFLGGFTQVPAFLVLSLILGFCGFKFVLPVSRHNHRRGGCVSWVFRRLHFLANSHPTNALRISPVLVRTGAYRNR